MLARKTGGPLLRAWLETLRGLTFGLKTWKQSECPSTDEWMKKGWCLYTTEYHSAIKKNEIMPFAATWMDLEIIILSEVSQTKKYRMISFTCEI